MSLLGCALRHLAFVTRLYLTASARSSSLPGRSCAAAAAFTASRQRAAMTDISCTPAHDTTAGSRSIAGISPSARQPWVERSLRRRLRDHVWRPNNSTERHVVVTCCRPMPLRSSAHQPCVRSSAWKLPASTPIKAIAKVLSPSRAGAAYNIGCPATTSPTDGL